MLKDIKTALEKKSGGQIINYFYAVTFISI